jgi:hypothetical protein
MTDWAPGDDALCIVNAKWCDFVDGYILEVSTGPRPGQMLRVVDVTSWTMPNYPIVPSDMRGSQHVMLHFAEYPDPKGWWARAFRKIRPLTNEEVQETHHEIHEPQKELVECPKT